MSLDDFVEYISKLWAMRIWGNKQYVVDKLISDNDFKKIKKYLSKILWSEDILEKRWDDFRENIKGFGPAMISEILCHTFPEECMLWNRRAYIALNYLEEKKLPQYNYQVTGKKYKELCEIVKQIKNELCNQGDPKANMLTVDYFLWDELQITDNTVYSCEKDKTDVEIKDVEAMFIHNEIRDKIADIGKWLGLNAETEKNIANGAKVDALWEATIGNMGRVIYVFEVQTKGSIDSLILNLIKALNNPAVQGVVAVSDIKQIEKIKKEAADVKELNNKLKYWDYQEVINVHEALQSVYESINGLGLVPDGF